MNEPRAGRGARGRPPQVPPTPREPIGRERAGASAHPRRPGRAEARPERPDLGLEPGIELPPRVRKELDRLVSDRARADDAKRALALGTEASEAEDHDTARRYLRWAKHLVPRSASVREALGIASYRAGAFRAALSELQAYRRLSGSDDQNHLLADCLRAEGREPERAIEVAERLAADAAADIERRVEAAIVAAAVHLDLGRPERADRILMPMLTRTEDAELRVRLLWVAADAAEAAGEAQRAVDRLDELLALDPDYPDADERRTRLHGESQR